MLNFNVVYVYPTVAFFLFLQLFTLWSQSFLVSHSVLQRALISGGWIVTRSNEHSQSDDVPGIGLRIMMECYISS